LRPDSKEATKLEDHVRKSIDELIARDEGRDPYSQMIWSFGPLPIVGLAVWGLTVWLEHGIPKALRPIVDGLQWFVIGLLLLLFVRFLWQWGNYLVRLCYAQARVWYLRTRLWYAQAELWYAKRSAWWAKGSAERKYRHEVMEILNPQKDEIIEKGGKEAWDAFVSEEFERLGAKGEEQVKADQPSNDNT
jgi:hypothetical protein